MSYPETPDGRYFVAKGRLWRKTNPALADNERRAHIKELMKARRAVHLATNDDEVREARAQVDRAKRALGERGSVWWTDGAPDEGGKAPKNTSYAAWWDALDDESRARGGATQRP